MQRHVGREHLARVAISNIDILRHCRTDVFEHQRTGLVAIFWQIGIEHFSIAQHHTLPLSQVPHRNLREARHVLPHVVNKDARAHFADADGLECGMKTDVCRGRLQMETAIVINLRLCASALRGQMAVKRYLAGLSPSAVSHRIVIDLPLEHAGVGHLRFIAHLPAVIGLCGNHRRVAVFIPHRQSCPKSQLVAKVVPVAAGVGHAACPPAFGQLDEQRIVALQHPGDIILLIVVSLVVLRDARCIVFAAHPSAVQFCPIDAACRSRERSLFDGFLFQRKSASEQWHRPMTWILQHPHSFFLIANPLCRMGFI